MSVSMACEYVGVSQSTPERYTETGRITKYRRSLRREVLFRGQSWIVC